MKKGKRSLIPSIHVDLEENRIRKEWEEKERNCTIVGEGYAERQIEATLKLVEKIDTEI